MLGRKSDDGGHQLQEFVSELTANQSRIRAFLVSMMPGSPDVADVLQETNIVLWKSRGRYKPGTNFLAWASTIARLEVLHYRMEAHARETGKKASTLSVALLRIREALRECIENTMKERPERMIELRMDSWMTSSSTMRC